MTPLRATLSTTSAWPAKRPGTAASTPSPISTAENSDEDMELMFPNHRYVLLPNISRLPAVLPRLYMQLTK